MDIAGRIAVVTGAGIGTGRAIAVALAAAGAEVVVSDVEEEGGRRTVALCDGRARFGAGRSHARVRRPAPDRVRRAHDPRQQRGLGGGHIPPHFPTASPEQRVTTLDLNLRAPMLATQLALAPMRRAGGGAIVNVASVAGLGSEPYPSPEYGAAKAGLIRFTSALAAVDGVRVNCIVPDWVATERLTGRDARASRRRSRSRP